MKRFLKHGIAIKSKKELGVLDNRFKTHRTTFRWLTPEFGFTCSDSKVVECIETMQEKRFGSHLNPNSSENFEGVSVAELKANTISLLNSVCPGQWSEIPQEKLDEYNKDVDNIIKEGIHIDEEVSEDVKQISITTQNNIETQNITTQNNIETQNNISVNINVDLKELKDLLTQLDSFTIKKLDPLLEKFKIAKHGNKEKKIEKLKAFIQSKLKDSKEICDMLNNPIK